MKWDLGIGSLIQGVTDMGTAWVESGAKKVRARAEEAVKTAREQGKTDRAAIEATAGTKRALIKKGLRTLRRAAFTILALPFAVGALIIVGAYAAAWWHGVPADPDFTPLTLFWSEVVDKTPDWWVISFQRALGFLWAAGEVVNVGADAGESVMQYLRQRSADNAGERRAEAEAKDAERMAEREKRNREREARGEPPLADPEEMGDRSAGREHSRTGGGSDDIPEPPSVRRRP